MANFTAADVKRLRELTGAGMLACKNALAETDGDFDKAVEALRIKGAKDVGKRAERATAEGLVAAKDGALIELNCETDFVAKNAEFQTLADQVVAAAAAAKPADVDALKGASIGDKTVEQAIAELSAKIGEKLELRRVAISTGPWKPTCIDVPLTCRQRWVYWSSTAATTRPPRTPLRCKSPRCGRGTCPATTCLKTSWPANAASPRRRQGPRASRSRRCPRLSRAG